MPTLMIYGATGYTGCLATLHAKKLGIDFVLAGRTEATVRDFASHLGAPFRIFDVGNAQLIDSALEGVSALLNCAGPFMRTAEPLMRGCIRNGVHYLDIAAELDSYRLADKLDREAKEAKVMLLPGCGGSVTMLGCLAGYAVANVESTPTSIDIALFVAGSMSRGSATSALENLTTECLQRCDGKLTAQNPGDTRQFDFDDGKGSVTAYPVTLPDLITIGRSTNAANIRTFVHVSGDAFPTEDVSNLPDGPTAEQREASPQAGGTSHGEGYTFTSIASVEAARKALDGRFAEGFQTPADVFGNDFVETIAGSSIKDI